MQIKVTQVKRQDTNKDGIAYQGKYGHYWIINIKDENENWYSTFCSKENDPHNKIEVGGTYSISVSESVKGDKVFKNFKLLTPEEKELEELRALKASLEKSENPVAAPAPTDEIDLDKF